MSEPLPYRDPEQLADDQQSGDEYQAELLAEYIDKHWKHFVAAIIESWDADPWDIEVSDVESYIRSNKCELDDAIKAGAISDPIGGI